MAAGVTLDALQKALPDGQPVVRCMPNTPSSVGRGALSVTPGEHTSAEQLAQVKDVLATVGTVVEVPEHLIRAVTGVSGSGPAYVFYLAEAMQQAGEKLGLDPETARVLAKETVSGRGRAARPGRRRSRGPAPGRHQPGRHHRAGHHHVRREGPAGHRRRRGGGLRDQGRRDGEGVRRAVTPAPAPTPRSQQGGTP